MLHELSKTLYELSLLYAGLSHDGFTFAVIS